MSTIKAPRPSLKTVLKTTTVAGLAAVPVTTGLPAEVAQSFAEAVRVQAPAVAVSPMWSTPFRRRSSPSACRHVNASATMKATSPSISAAAGSRTCRKTIRCGVSSANSLRVKMTVPIVGATAAVRVAKVVSVRGRKAPASSSPKTVTSSPTTTSSPTARTFTVIMNDGTELDAKLVGKDSRTDLAVLKVDDKRKFTYVSFADDEKVRVGDWVVAVGNPFGLGGTVTAGIISARGRDIGSGPYDDYLQVDAAVNRGNSGGPTFNLSGEVVGINTAIFSPSGGNVGIAFAIPASVAKDVVDSLIKDGTVSRGWLGVQIQPVTKDIAESLGLSEANGALVVEPQAGSPGEKAGIKNGDVVTALNGEPVKDPRDLARRVAALRPGSTAEVTLWRSGKSETVNLEIGTLPSDAKEPAPATGEAQPDEGQAGEEALADLGLTVTPSEDGKGVTIASVDPDSDAGDRGLKEGEKIVSVNNQEVNRQTTFSR
nr:RmDEGP [Sinorhizobium meliloti]prf//2204296A periplasmic endopeptidase [Sinorhizobium meliloti]